MDTGLRDGKKRTLEEQAALVKELGYDGFGAGFGQMPGIIAACEKAGLRLDTVYVGASVDPSKPKHDGRLPEMIKALKGQETIIWLYVTGGKASATDRDDRAVEIIREIADMAAASGLKVALYPHTGLYVASVGDAVRVAKKVDRKNVGVTFNLCHWLRVEPGADLDKTLQLAKPYLLCVSINGADNDGKDWKTLIQPLDRGSFDNLVLLKKLKALGFKGPIGLQHYGIQGDSRENLQRSIDAWKDLNAKLATGH